MDQWACTTNNLCRAHHHNPPCSRIREGGSDMYADRMVALPRALRSAALVAGVFLAITAVPTTRSPAGRPSGSRIRRRWRRSICRSSSCRTSGSISEAGVLPASGSLGNDCRRAKRAGDPGHVREARSRSGHRPPRFARPRRMGPARTWCACGSWMLHGAPSRPAPASSEPGATSMPVHMSPSGGRRSRCFQR